MRSQILSPEYLLLPREDEMYEFESYLPSILALSPLLLIAVYLTVSRPHIGPSARSGRFILAAVVAMVCQSIHFTEELLWGFAGSLPGSFGFTPMDTTIFAAFNLFWFAVWAICVWRVRAGSVAAMFPLWFLSIAAILNLPAHVILAVRAGGYFPGVLTAPAVAVAGTLLLIEMVRATKHVADK